MRKIKSSALLIGASFGLLACGQSRNVTANQSGTGASPENVDINPAVEISISEDEVGETLRYLSSEELQGRKTGTDGIEKAAQYIEKVFKENGVQPYYETYRDSFEVKGVTGYNVIGYLEGSDPELKDEFIIIGAHYDHIGNGKPVGEDTLANGANATINASSPANPKTHHCISTR